MINNIGRGPRRDKNVVEDYADLENDAGRAWFLPHHGNTDFTGMQCLFGVYLKINAK